MGGGAADERHWVVDASAHDAQGRVRQHVAVHGRRVELGWAKPTGARKQGNQLGGRDRPQASRHVGRTAAAGQVGDPPADRLDFREGEGEPVSAVGDGPVEEAAGQRRGEEDPDILGAGRLAEDRDARGIPPEGRDVVTHPAQARHLVEDAVVAGHAVRARGAEGGVAEEAQGAQPVVAGHDHCGPGGGEPAAVVDGLGRGALVVAAAVVPNHRGERWPPLAGGEGRPHVEGETVFVAADLSRAVELWTDGAELARVPDRAVAQSRLRVAPAPTPEGRSGVGDPLEDTACALLPAAVGGARRRDQAFVPGGLGESGRAAAGENGSRDRNRSKQQSHRHA